MGGNDDKENLVKLTAREHFLAHLLLSKIYPNKKGLIIAIQMMCVSSNSHNENRINNRMYSWLKNKFSEEMSKNQQGYKNSNFGTMWIHNFELKTSKNIKKEDFDIWIENGWKKGRKFDFTLNFCIVCNKEISKKSKFCSNGCSIKYKKENNNYINPFQNKKHSENFKNSMKNHTRNNGVDNPMYGMKYIYNPETLEYKRCKDEILKDHLSLGWLYGKKPKKK